VLQTVADTRGLQAMLGSSNKQAALNALFEEYRPVLYAIALRMLGHGDDAKDAVQDTYLKASTHIETLKDIKATGAWLMSIVRNHCLMELRHRKNQKEVYTDSLSDYVIADACTKAEQSPYEIRHAISHLSEPVQLTTMLRYYSRNNSYDEIATVLGVPVGTIRSRLADARTKLSATLKKDLPFAKSNKAKEMEDFFGQYFNRIHFDASARDYFFQHIEKDLIVSVTSGKIIRGSKFIEKEIDFDLKHGVNTRMSEVNSSGNISVLEIDIQNPEDKPDLCPIAATFIMVHPKLKTEKLLLHNSARAYVPQG
jgi:RNA polymerase sigma factor (sigma-70 family)